MARLTVFIAVILCGCALPPTPGLSPGGALLDQSVQQLASQGEATGVVATPEGDVAVIRSPPIAPQDLCYIRARRIRLALVPIRCADLVRAPDQ
jgi:hypothetical protein